MNEAVKAEKYVRVEQHVYVWWTDCCVSLLAQLNTYLKKSLKIPKG